MKQKATPDNLDIKALAQSSGTVAGHNPLSEFGRLIRETQGLGAEKKLNWSVRGELRTDALGTQQVCLHLDVDVGLPLTCQRCMTPAEIAVVVHRSFRFVDNEETAEAQDPESEDDLLVLSADFSLTELIQDEVLMELPLIPKHEVCPVKVKLAAVDKGFGAAAEEQGQPFALLAQLKNGNSG